jgi:regulator of replication initiation timing
MSDTNKNAIQITEELIDEVLKEVRRMKSDIKLLQSENERLRNELNKTRGSGTTQNGEMFGMNSAEKLALRQKVLGLIERIDKHLPGGAV